MAITAGQIIRADDFVSSSAGSGDSGRVPKLDAAGKIDISFVANLACGDGSDGDVTIGAGTTTLTRDMYYNNLVITGTLATAGYRVFVKGTVSGAGILSVAPGVTGYFGYTAGSASAGQGSSGNPGLAGIAGASPTATMGASNSAAASTGGNSGNGNSGTAPGAVGVATKPYLFSKHAVSTIEGIYASGSTILKIATQPGAPSGGGGGGSGATSGGAGGAGGNSGGVVFLSANTWSGAFTISAVGGAAPAAGNGNNGGSYGGGGGGGGAGGSGGIAIIIYGHKTWTGSYVLTGGAGGAGGNGGSGGTPGGSGNPGNTGTAGTAYEIQGSALVR